MVPRPRPQLECSGFMWLHMHAFLLCIIRTGSFNDHTLATSLGNRNELCGARRAALVRRNHLPRRAHCTLNSIIYARLDSCLFGPLLSFCTCRRRHPLMPLPRRWHHRPHQPPCSPSPAAPSGKTAACRPCRSPPGAPSPACTCRDAPGSPSPQPPAPCSTP